MTPLEGMVKEIPAGMKRCARPSCGQIKPLSEFHRRNRGPDGHYNTCKTCRNQSMRKSQQKLAEMRALQKSEEDGGPKNVLRCLRCDRLFESRDRVLNRVCDLCKNTNDWQSPAEPAVLGRMA